MGHENPEEEWRQILAGEHRAVLSMRRAFRRIPAAPRCKLCHAPFAGPGGFVLRPWFGPWERNAQLCKSCMRQLLKTGIGGAEVEISLLFADIRGSTSLGERLRPAEFSAVMSAFYRLGAHSITEADGIVDKFVGDEVIGLFIPGYAGRDHAGRAIAAGTALIAAAGRADATVNGPIPVGVGIHTGIAFVGTIGSSEQISDFTALGDTVNTTARLASLAAAGEILVSSATVDSAGRAIAGSERRTVEVRGREATLDVFAARPTT